MTVFDLMAKISLDTAGYEENLMKAKAKFADFGSGISSGAKSIATATLSAASKVGELGSAFLKSSISAGGTFDASMAQVAATMGKTVDEIQDLREFAQKMGAETVFSATQAADALNYMALAGYDANKSMEMLPAVLDLAASGGIDLARASDMITDAQSALGLSSEETLIMVDQMAKTASTTNTSVAQLGDAILTVGANAKTVKGGTQEIAQVLGLMADNGIKASESGTHLRNILLQMTPNTDKAAEAWEKLGVQTYDAEGNMRHLSDIFQELSAAMQGMSDQERTSTLSAMFNKTDLASVNALLDTSVERWNSVDEAISNANGAANAMANTQLDNLQGDVTLFKSAWEGLQIAVSDKVTPALRKFVQFGSTQVSNLSKALKDEGLSGAFKYVLETIKTLGTKAKDILVKLAPKVAEALPSIIESLITGIGERFEMVMQIAYVLLDGLKNGITKNLPKLLEVAITIIKSISDFLVETLPEMIPAIVEIIMQLVVVLSDPKTLVPLIDATLAIIMALVEGLLYSLPKFLEQADVIISNLFDALIEALPKLLYAAKEIIAMLVAGIIANLDKILAVAVTIVMKIAEGIYTWGHKLYTTAVDSVNQIKEGFSTGIEAAKTWGKDLVDNFIGGIKAKWNNLKETVAGLAQTVQDYIGFSEPKLGPLSNFHTYAPDMMDLFAKGIRDNRTKITGELSEALYGVDNVMSNMSVAGYGGNTINVNVSGMQIANDYDSYRFAEKVSQALKTLQIRDMRSIGGY